jgi:UDP-N-acetylmuramate dehydrogenase
MKLERNIDLSPYNSFGVVERARLFTRVSSADDILECIPFEKEPLVLGSGTNLLFTKEQERLIIKNEVLGFEIQSESDDAVELSIGSGENWHAFVRQTVHHGWSGCENLSLIPGTVGAGPVQNIGAYGAEIKDVLRSVQAIEWATGQLVEFSKEDCAFGYRDSIFKHPDLYGRYFILAVRLRLSKSWQPLTSYGEIEKNLNEQNIQLPSLQDMHETIIRIRSNKLPDPQKLGNAGSFFKNPVIDLESKNRLQAILPDLIHYPLPNGQFKIPAGWLIDKAGWKGKKIGRVGCYEKQALVIVNHGGASGGEVWQFALTVQADLMDRFGILLEPEINIL